MIEKLLANPFTGDGTLHPDLHLIYVDEVCELFKLAGMPEDIHAPIMSDAFSFTRPKIIYIITITMNLMHRIKLLMKFQLQSLIIPRSRIIT